MNNDESAKDRLLVGLREHVRVDGGSEVVFGHERQVGSGGVTPT
jgi:hypothetical protein